MKFSKNWAVLNEEHVVLRMNRKIKERKYSSSRKTDSKRSCKANGKVQFSSMKEAEVAAKVIKESFGHRVLYLYKCDQCAFWHHTSIPQK